MRRSILYCFCLATIFSTELRAQSSTDLTVADPRKTYFSFKRSFGALPKESIIGDEYDEIQLSSCVSASEALGTDTGKKFPFTRRLAELAFDVLYIEGVLNRGKYPRSLWANDLATYEEKQLKQFIASRGQPSADDPDPAKVALAQKLNSYRVTHKMLHRVSPKEEGCGDMMGPVLRIQTVPDAKRIQYMVFHFAALCADQGLDFKNEEECPYWIDYSAGLMLRGKYKFLVKWTTGPPAYRDYDFDKLKDGDDGKYHIKVEQ
jgi:hypothetical protein